jgi:hypothetical protein
MSFVKKSFSYIFVYYHSKRFLGLHPNVGHMSIGGVRSDLLSTEAETTIEILRLATYKARHYLYAVLCPVVFIICFIFF